MSMVYECQECKILQSALTENGLCIQCAMKRSEKKIYEATIKIHIIECNGDTEKISKITNAEPELIEKLKEEINFKPLETSYYCCTACGRNTDVIVSRMGRSGICQTCADRLERGLNLIDREDKYREPVNRFSATDVTPRMDEPKPKNNGNGYKAHRNKEKNK